MNQKLKALLQEGFEAPVPIKKREFLRSIETEPASGWAFLLSQAGYIRKWVWGLSVLIFSVAFVGATMLERNMLWCISSFMPLLAMAVITETGRSEACGMAELELSTRFSLRSVVLARTCILGMADVALLSLLVPMTILRSGMSFFQTGMYLLCPYLLTAFLGLWVMRRVRRKDAIYFCIGISAGVSVANSLLYTRYTLVFADRNLIWWLVSLIILGIGILNQGYYRLKQMEELAWN